MNTDWMTAEERNEYDKRLAAVDAAVQAARSNYLKRTGGEFGSSGYIKFVPEEYEMSRLERGAQ